MNIAIFKQLSYYGRPELLLRPEKESSSLLPPLTVKIYNRRRDRIIPSDAIDCTRRGPWGNPFEIGPDGNRDDVCDKHSMWLDTEGISVV